jgi:hypothetical protein
LAAATVANETAAGAGEDNEPPARSELEDGSQYGTPLGSPAASTGDEDSLYTADEGGTVVWLEGNDGPTQTDRQVVSRTTALKITSFFGKLSFFKLHLRFPVVKEAFKQDF